MDTSIKTPTCGRIVHYFPNMTDLVARANNAEVIPFLVIQPFNEGENCMVNGHIFPMKNVANCDSPNIAQIETRWSIPHKSMAGENQAYWDWPEIK